MNHVVRIEDMPKEIQILGKRLGDDGKRAMYLAARLAANDVQKEIDIQMPRGRYGIMGNPVATKSYRRAWEVRKREYGAILGNPLRLYPKVVENGAKPHMPPMQPILEWVAIKFKSDLMPKKKKRYAEDLKPKDTIIGDWLTAMGVTKDKIKRKSVKPKWKTGPAAQAIAWAIRKSISKVGIKGYRILFRASKNFKQHVIDSVLKEWNRGKN